MYISLPKVEPMETSMINTQVIEEVSAVGNSNRPTFEQSMTRRQDADVLVQGNQGARRMRREIDSERDRDSVMVEMRPQREPIDHSIDLLKNNQDSSKSMANKIRSRILQRDKEFKKCNPLEIKSKPDFPNNRDAMKYLLKELKIEKRGIVKSGLRGVPRPCFHPSGGISFVKGKKVQVVPIEKIDPDC